jgi:phosphoglycolate phosphatase-like HAD superfamily hydrolase
MSDSYFHNGSHIEVFRDGVNFDDISHAVFDHDGTISTLREGWEAVMHPVMMDAILGSERDSIGDAEHAALEKRVTEYIDESTGIQTILQMEALVALVREFGYVPESDVRTPQEYKEIYNDALMIGVDERIADIRANTTSLEQWLIPGARDFLQALYDRGIKLYLASGTDDADVKNEAELLGYADLFEGRIYGSVGDVKKYSKKKVLEGITREHGLGGSELITFGDGPVEIKETRRLDGTTVGIASHEGEGGGLCPEKRERLIRAGADMIVPDFSQADALLSYFFE